jgi:hypothetical protein
MTALIQVGFGGRITCRVRDPGHRTHGHLRWRVRVVWPAPALSRLCAHRVWCFDDPLGCRGVMERLTGGVGPALPPWGLIRSSRRASTPDAGGWQTPDGRSG